MYTYVKDGDRFKTTGGWLFRTEAEAAEFCRLWNEHFAAMEPLGELPRLSREEYVAACAKFGVRARSDAECDSYGVRYGEFGPYHAGYRMEAYTPEFCVEMALARRRLNGIEAERKAQPRAKRQPDYPEGRRLDCGCIVFFKSEVMRASLGTSCADCYDRMSD